MYTVNVTRPWPWHTFRRWRNNMECLDNSLPPRCITLVPSQYVWDCQLDSIHSAGTISAYHFDSFAICGFGISRRRGILMGHHNSSMVALGLGRKCFHYQTHRCMASSCLDSSCHVDALLLRGTSRWINVDHAGENTVGTCRQVRRSRFLISRTHTYPAIALSHISDTMFAVSRSSTTFWTMLIHDYGICSTIAAVMTLATIGCLLAIMLRTLTPRKRKQQSQQQQRLLQQQQQQQQQQYSERKKKKRKGQYPRGRGRLRSTKGIPEHAADKPANVVQQSQQPLNNEPSNKSVIDTLRPVPEPRAVSPEMVMRPRIQSFSAVESIDDQSTTSSVRSFASAPTVQTIMTTSSERSGKSTATPAPNVPTTKGKLHSIKSLNGKKKSHGINKNVTSLAVERGDGQLSPGKQSRSGNNFGRGGPKSLRTFDKDVKNPVVTTPNQSYALPRPMDNSGRGGQSHPRQHRCTYSHHQQQSPQPSFSPVLHDDTHSFFSTMVSTNSTSKLNAASPPYTPRRLPSLSHNFGPIGQSPRIAPAPEVTPRDSYSVPRYCQPYSEQPYSLTWDTTPIRPPPGLEGMLPSSPFGTHPTSYAYDDPDDKNDILGDESESRIDAELQELGGQMVGSILDF